MVLADHGKPDTPSPSVLAPFPGHSDARNLLAPVARRARRLLADDDEQAVVAVVLTAEEVDALECLTAPRADRCVATRNGYRCGSPTAHPHVDHYFPESAYVGEPEPVSEPPLTDFERWREEPCEECGKANGAHLHPCPFTGRERVDLAAPFERVKVPLEEDAPAAPAPATASADKQKVTCAACKSWAWALAGRKDAVDSLALIPPDGWWSLVMHTRDGPMQHAWFCEWACFEGYYLRRGRVVQAALDKVAPVLAEGAQDAS